MESLVGWSSGSVLAGESGRSVAPLDPDSGALGGSFRPAPRSVGYTTAESCGNRRVHPGCRPERSSQSAISRLERSPRESSPRHQVARRPLGQQPRQRGSSPRHRVARHLRVAKRGSSCAPGDSADRSGGRGARRGRRPCGARGGAGCPNLLQRRVIDHTGDHEQEVDHAEQQVAAHGHHEDARGPAR